MTQSGADAFIGSGTTTYIYTNVQGTRPDRVRMTLQLNRQEREAICGRLESIYVMFDCIAECSTPSVFQQRIPISELQTLVDHCIDVFSNLATSPRWTKTGVLMNYDQKLLDCLISYCKHYNFVKLLIVKNNNKK
jgi:hypothetical protein